MAQDLLADRIRTLTDSFVRDLTELVRASAFEALKEALGGTGLAPPEKVRPKAANLPVLELTPAAPPKAMRTLPSSMPPPYLVVEPPAPAYALVMPARTEVIRLASPYRG